MLMLATIRKSTPQICAAEGARRSDETSLQSADFQLQTVCASDS